MSERILSRAAEQHELQAMLNSPDAEFLAIYGRRRIGKTFLISEFFKDKGVYLEFTGIKNANLKTQLQNFADGLIDQLPKMPATHDISDWLSALRVLRKEIEKIPTSEQIIIFFDELPWIASPKSEFMPALEHLWNRYLSRMNNVILIICGSAASWMIDNIISNTGGLYGRLTRKIRLLPFTLAETNEYLLANGIRLEQRSLIEVYMAVGGVAKYLSQFKRGISVPQNIDNLFFSNTGYFYGEFERLYSSLFNKYELHIAIVRTLANHPEGLSRDVLLERLALSSGGGNSKILRELEESGFIVCVPFYGKKKRLSRFRLIDQYSLFYLKWVENIQIDSFLNKKQHYWLHQHTSRSYQTWAGYAFENICLLHVQDIINKIGLGNVLTTAATWSLKGNKQQMGAQIDLVIERADNCINLCEIKFCNDVFTISKSYAKELEQKRRLFAEHTKSRKSLFTTLITTYGLKPNEHALHAVDQALSFTDIM